MPGPDEPRDVHIAIVGGGTAGWLTAFALASSLPDDYRIALVESPSVPVIGVGESTLPTLGSTLTQLGVDEDEWMRETGATYKLGVRFRNWCDRGSQVSRADFWNPVEQICDPDAVAAWFQHAKRRDFSGACCTTTPLLEQGRVPRTSGARSAECAFHVDATRLAGVLRARAVACGVEHRIGHVVHVSRSDERTIDHVRLADGDAITAQLFIDCTGFRAVLLGEAMAEPWLSYERSLLTDSAVAISIPRPGDDQPIPPYTTARAMLAGWMWSVPLVDRTGSGYVYSSRYRTPDQAESELRAALGPAASAEPARHLATRTGRRRRSWVGNCVAIGLASGFVEPLEATGIYFVERAIVTLLTALRSGDRSYYNRVMTAAYEEVRDLIVMHYLVNDRQDTPFWKATKREALVPDVLAERLETWSHRVPTADDFSESAVFGLTTWMSVLAGMGFWRVPIDLDDRYLPATALVGRTRSHLLAHSTEHRLLMSNLAR